MHCLRVAGLGKYLNCYDGLAASPNVGAYEVIGYLGYGMAQDLLVKFFALRDIMPGEQLLIDYGPMYDGYDWEAAWKIRQHHTPTTRASQRNN